MPVVINSSPDIIKNSETGEIVLSKNFDDMDVIFSHPGDQFIISIVGAELENIKNFTLFEYDSIGLIDTRYLLQYYRVSRDKKKWSEWLDLNREIVNFPIIDPLDPFYIEIKWVRVGVQEIGEIKLLSYKLVGNVLRNDSSLSESAVRIGPFESKIIESPFIYKVFRIDNFEIIPESILDNSNIKWRFSQDSTKTWSEWEPLTKENISTVRINPIRFFRVEYLIENTSSGNLKVYDINLIGDFQNVSLDSQKTNLLGIRECCKSNISTAGESNCEADPFAEITDEERSKLYNPYAQSSALKLLEKLSTDSEDLFGHRVTYFVTDADEKGQDHSLNEYQLYNVVCSGDIKVSITDNNFPDSQIKMNVFELDLFDTMEANITKKQFKKIFGSQRRPSKEDFLYFCDVNRMYQVDHAQQFRNFNNSAVYYKLILKKYNQKANVKAATPEIKNKIETLTKNTTIEELMGIEKAQDKASVANKQQFTPLTRDPIRLEYIAQIDRELIENSSTIISKANYDLSSVRYREPAVNYANLDPILRVSDNIGYQIWFSINNYLEEEVYNLFYNYDSANSLGWKAELMADSIKVTLNSDEYDFVLPESLNEDTWYCYVLNINQRARNIEQFIYKRNTDDEDEAAKLQTTILKKVYHEKVDMSPVNYQLEEITPKILASDMKVTNIRLFIDVIPENVHNKVLNQYIIRDDSKYLVFADNATTRLYLPKFYFNE
jgi:hypothetical protein